MKKKVIIGIVCAVVVIAIVALIVCLTGNKSPKATAKNLAKALESSEKLEKFLTKNIDFKANEAMDKASEKLNSASITDLDSYKKEYTKAFEEAYKEVTKDEIKEAKEDLKKDFEEEENSYSDYIAKDLKVKEIGDLEDNDIFPMFKKMNVVYEDGENEVEYTLFFYKKKLVTFVPTSYVTMYESLMQKGLSAMSSGDVEE